MIDRRSTARSGADLLREGIVADGAAAASADRLAEHFSMAVPAAFLELIDPAADDDPIARQYVPDLRELEAREAELADPIGDDPYTPVTGITHRYPDRLLLKPIHVCPVYCRFCFRREKVGVGGEALTATELEAAFEYIRRHEEVWEVILTGGDPLVLSDRRLGALVTGLAAIPHVRVLRIHTRFPVAEPGRISPALVDALRSRLATYVVLHCNHPRELTGQARVACARLIDGGIPMLSQSVLLRGVNDDEQVLEQLLRAFVENRIKPYYLHHLDMARGTSHFRTSVERGRALMKALRGRVSGVCQPTYVLDIPGGYGKVPIGPVYLHERGDGAAYAVEDYRGTVHAYEPGPEREPTQPPLDA